MIKLLMIAAGGAVGATARYALSGLCQPSGSSFPIGTLAVNVVGCLGMGLAMAFFAGPQLVREEMRVALLIGVLGGFTTFSTFAWETYAGSRWNGLANVLLSNVLGLTAVWIGYRVGQKLFGVS